MKHQTEKRSEQVMRFFTPDIYTRFNSPDDNEADQANDEWEKAVTEYRQHLDKIRESMPSQVRKLADMCLHDAELLGFEQPTESFFPFQPYGSPFCFAIAILSVKQDNDIESLIYLLWDRIRECPSPADWRFSKSRTHWLYDEIDVASNQRGGLFLHRIFLSDGRVLEIPFISAIRHKLALPNEKTQSCQIA